jgi:hypothetical protein
MTLDAEKKKHLVSAPRDFFLAPVFAATPQTGSRKVRVGDTTYEIGGFNPINPADAGNALDVRHATLTFGLLSFWDPRNPTPTIQFSMAELCRRYAWTRGGKFARHVRELLNDLFKSYIRIQHDGESERHSYRLFERIHAVERPIRRKDDNRANAKQYELWFDQVTLSQEFFDLLQNIVERHHLRFDVFVSIGSNLARAIYLYIPSRAHHHTEADPFEITLTRLLEQVAHPVPEQKSKRRQLFTQNKHSILSQLDGKETLSGVFRVKLAETADESDWKLQCWVEKPDLSLPPLSRPSSPSLADSKMVKAFVASGKTLAEAKKRIENVKPFSNYEFECFERGKIILDGNEKAFELAKALLGEFRFDQLLAEAKNEVLERRAATKSPNHRLMSRLMEALRSS